MPFVRHACGAEATTCITNANTGFAYFGDGGRDESRREESRRGVWRGVESPLVAAARAAASSRLRITMLSR